MKLIQLVLVAAVAGGAYHYWNKRQEASAEVAAGESSADSPRGFVALPPVSGENANVVLIVAAENCPEEAAQRADRLADDLTHQGVPVSRVHTVSFQIAGNDMSIANRVTSVMNGELPIVFVHGKAKSNPTLEDVAAEYRGATR
jgi:hypothetical protein